MRLLARARAAIGAGTLPALRAETLGRARRID
jgi:hypothetical protein